MNFYPHHIGDYAAHTAHLSALEDCFYRRMLDRYYQTEQPLPADLDALCRVLRARDKQERAAVAVVSREFFDLDGDVLRQKRCDAEILAYQVRADTAKANGKRGGRPPKTQGEPKPNPDETQRVISGLAKENPDETLAKANQNHNQINPPTPRKRGDEIPFDEIAAAYNATMTRLPRVREMTDARKRAIRRAWEESPQRRSVEGFWLPYFEECESSDFHNGTGPYTNGHEKWRPDFDFLVQPKTIVKVYERAMQRVESQPHA